VVKLTNRSGDLYLNGEILIYRYICGDCDAISWPNPNPQRLASVLFDAFECGDLRSRTVLLPDGTEFDIDDNLE